MLTPTTELPTAIETPVRSILRGSCGSSVNASGHCQNSGAALRAARGTKISGDRRAVPGVV